MKRSETHFIKIRPVWTVVTGLTCGIALSLIMLFHSVTFQEWPLVFVSGTSILKSYHRLSEKQFQQLQNDLKKNNELLAKKLDKYIPVEPYLVVNTSTNHFRLMKSTQLIREGICSTGSYILLRAGDEQEWIFKTPRGLFKIQNKIESPVWRKPDWAFVEEGLPIPPSDSQERYERGVLGDYAMAIGHGYLIHGTLYKRFLGMPVTHGCIRLGDDDLEAVYKSMRIGSKVFIY